MNHDKYYYIKIHTVLSFVKTLVLLTLSRRLAISALIWCGSYFVLVEYPEKAKEKENVLFYNRVFKINEQKKLLINHANN